MPTENQIIGGLRLRVLELEALNKIFRRALEEMKAEEGQREIDAEALAVCVWTEDPDGIWTGPCGVAWEFDNDGPEENRCRYCPRCGGKIEAHPYEDEEGEQDGD